MTLYQVWILALYIAAMVFFALALFVGFGRGIAAGLLCWATIGFSATVNSIT